MKIVSDLQYLMMKLFAIGSFGRPGPWKCLHGQSEGDLDGWLKVQPWAPMCRRWPGNYVSVPCEPHEVCQEHLRETTGQFSGFFATPPPSQLHGGVSGTS